MPVIGAIPPLSTASATEPQHAQPGRCSEPPLRLHAGRWRSSIVHGCWLMKPPFDAEGTLGFMHWPDGVAGFRLLIAISGAGHYLRRGRFDLAWVVNAIEPMAGVRSG